MSFAAAQGEPRRDLGVPFAAGRGLAWDGDALVSADRAFAGVRGLTHVDRAGDPVDALIES